MVILGTGRARSEALQPPAAPGPRGGGPGCTRSNPQCSPGRWAVGAGPCPEPWTSLHEIWACLGLLSLISFQHLVNGPALALPSSPTSPSPGPKTIWAQVPAVRLTGKPHLDTPISWCPGPAPLPSRCRLRAPGECPGLSLGPQEGRTADGWGLSPKSRSPTTREALVSDLSWLGSTLSQAVPLPPRQWAPGTWAPMRVIGCTIPPSETGVKACLARSSPLGAASPGVFPNPTPSPRILDTAREAKQCPSRDPLRFPRPCCPGLWRAQERPPGRRGRPRSGGRGPASRPRLQQVPGSPAARCACHGSPRSPPAPSPSGLRERSASHPGR